VSFNNGASIADMPDIDLTNGGGRLFERYPSAGQPYQTGLYRFGLWAGIAIPDITQAAVQANFSIAGTGVTEAPATSVAAYGTPIVDIYGPTADYNALVNNGSAGNFSSKTGTYA
jgi:hypothetical protein